MVSAVFVVRVWLCGLNIRIIYTKRETLLVCRYSSPHLFKQNNLFGNRYIKPVHETSFDKTLIVWVTPRT